MTIETVDFDDSAISFWVPGQPRPGGSKRYVGHSRKGHAILLDMGGDKTKHWRELVALFAAPHAPAVPVRGPLQVSFHFKMPRPKNHFYQGKRRKGQLREDSPIYHTSAPDALKLARSTEDALTAIIWADDAQTCQLTVHKTYGDTPGCHITISPL